MVFNISNAWWALAFEVLEVFTIHLMWVAAITYGAALSSESVLATVQGTICGVHYGIGERHDTNHQLYRCLLLSNNYSLVQISFQVEDWEVSSEAS